MIAVQASPDLYSVLLLCRPGIAWDAGGGLRSRQSCSTEPSRVTAGERPAPVRLSCERRSGGPVSCLTCVVCAVPTSLLWTVPFCACALSDPPQLARIQ